MSVFAIVVSRSCPKLLSTILTRYSTKWSHKLLNINLLKCCAYVGNRPNEVFCRMYSSSEEENPFKRTWNFFKNDSKLVVDFLDGNLKQEELTKKSFPEHCDILIIGGGIIGSSIAYWLQQRALSGLKVVVLEKDPSVGHLHPNSIANLKFEYKCASTVLSAGGLRHQFSLPENIQICLFGTEFLRNIDDYLGIEGTEKLSRSLQFTPQGYLYLSSAKGAHILEKNTKLQWSLGSSGELLTPKMLKERFPWMNTEGVELGCHGIENEGWFDPWVYLMAFKRKAKHLGTQFITGELESFKFVDQPEIIMDGIPPGDYVGVRAANIRLPDGSTRKLDFSQLVIAAGCNSGEVGKMLRVGSGPGFLEKPIPVEPRKRYIYSFHCPDGPGLNTPLVVDSSGSYFRRDGFGDKYICGLSPEESEEPPCDSLDVDYNFFEERIWPSLAYRVPAFKSLKIRSAWAGYYDYNTFDQNAFIGPHPSYMNVYLATGFSGHGLQQAAAVGRAMMEVIIDGRFVTIDLTRMQFERIFHDEYLLETNII